MALHDGHKAFYLSYLSKISYKVDHADNLKSGSASLVCNCLVPMLSHCAKWNFLGKGHFLTRRHSVIYADSRASEHLEADRMCLRQTHSLTRAHTNRTHSIPHKSELWPQYSSPVHSSLNGLWYINILLPLSLYLRTLLHTSWRLRSRPEGLVAVHVFSKRLWQWSVHGSVVRSMALQSVSLSGLFLCLIRWGIMALNVYFDKLQGHDESVTALERPRRKTDANCSFHIISSKQG